MTDPRHILAESRTRQRLLNACLVAVLVAALAALVAGCASKSNHYAGVARGVGAVLKLEADHYASVARGVGVIVQKDLAP